jgi:hypothetical protein
MPDSIPRVLASESTQPEFSHGLQEFSAAAPTVSDQRLSECRSPVQKSVRGWVAEALFGALIKA